MNIKEHREEVLRLLAEAESFVAVIMGDGSVRTVSVEMGFKDMCAAALIIQKKALTHSLEDE